MYQVWLALLVGLIAGWLIEWVIDWQFWRRDVRQLRAENMRLRQELSDAQGDDERGSKAPGAGSPAAVENSTAAREPDPAKRK